MLEVYSSAVVLQAASGSMLSYSPSFVNGLQNSRTGFRSCSASHFRKLITSTCPLKPIVTAPLCLRPTPPLSAGSGLLQASS
jgi:hypothetical protein